LQTAPLGFVITWNAGGIEEEISGTDMQGFVVVMFYSKSCCPLIKTFAGKRHSATPATCVSALSRADTISITNPNWKLQVPHPGFPDGP
jgi:hypothetical protein